MRHTLLAIRFSLTITLSLCLAFAANAWPQGAVVLDLTKMPSGQQTSLGVPGQQVSGTPGQQPSKYPLPLDIRIVKVRPNGSDLTVEINVTNRGKSAYLLPSCTDERKAYIGGKHRRALQFGFDFIDGEHRTSAIAEVTFASDRPECSIVLPKDRVASVIVAVKVPDEFRGAFHHAQLQAIWTQTMLEDDRMYVVAISDPVKSLIVKLG